MCIQPTGIWQHPEHRSSNCQPLFAYRCGRILKCGPIGAQAEHCENSGPVTPHLSSQPFPTRKQVFLTQFGSRRSSMLDHVGNAKTTFQKLSLIKWRQQTICKAGAMNYWPEPVSRTCKMVPHRGRIEARIDPAEEYLQPGRYYVGDGFPSRSEKLLGSWLPGSNHWRKEIIGYSMMNRVC